MTTKRDRTAAILKSTALNGIDFVEIASENQRRLNVHFLNKVALRPTDGVPPVTITGGETIPTVSVLTREWAKDAQDRPLLRLTVDAPGDFSTYTLSIDSPDLDRFHNRTGFSFKALCASSLDCEAMPHVCPADEADLPAISYDAKDFLSFRGALSDFSAVRYPDWKERNEADFGMVFMEALCAIADDLSYLQDRIAAEATLETATQRRSVVRHARLVDYEPRPAISSHVLLQFDVSTADDAIPAGVRVAAQGADGTRIAFETGKGLSDAGTSKVSERWNRSKKLAPYIWDDNDTCLEAGSTELWVAGNGHGFQLGQQLLIETESAVPGDPPLREIVTIANTPDNKGVKDALFNEYATHIVWSADEGLENDHDIGRTTVSGNLVPATQGRTTTESFFIPGGSAVGALAAARSGPRTDDGVELTRYLYTLAATPLTWLRTADESFVPEIRVAQIPAAGRIAWDWQRQLINADAADLAFTIESFRMRMVARNSDGTVSHDYDGDGGDTIRFGDGMFGAAPPAGAKFEVTYRSGDGARGNVAADSISSLDGNAPSFVSAVTNPFAAEGGEDEETNERVRRLAPQAFRAKTFRAVRSEDYTDAAEGLPWVSRAGSVFRWTGSWLTAFTTADPKADTDLSVPRRIELIDLLNRYRLAGYESYVLAPRYVSLDLIVEICASADAFRGDVEAGVLEALDSNHFFHADRFTFGTKLERSALEAAVQAVPGVSGVISVLFRRRGMTPGWTRLPEALPIGRNEILRVENNPSRPEHGSIRFRVKGGK